MGRMTITFGITELKTVREDVKIFLESMLDDHNAFFMNVAINEAVNNSLIHGKSTIISLSIEYTDNRVVVSIQDDGTAFDGNKEIQHIRQSEKNLFDEQLYQEGKRGLLILEKVCDEVIYHEEKQQLILVKNVSSK